MNLPESPDDPDPEEEPGQGEPIPEPESDGSDPPRPPGRVRRAQIYYRAAPLPTPQHLREYDEILPGAADRILGMAERRLALEERKLDQELRSDDQIHTETMTLLPGADAAGETGSVDRSDFGTGGTSLECLPFYPRCIPLGYCCLFHSHDRFYWPVCLGYHPGYSAQARHEF